LSVLLAEPPSARGARVVAVGPEPVPGTKPRGRRRRRLVRWLRGGLAFYLVGLLLIATFQERIIFPGHATQGRPDAVVEPGPDTELLSLRTARGDRVVALFGAALTADGRPRPDAARRPTLLFFYGNAMCLATARDLLDDLRRIGVNVLIPEYAGYGMSSGRPSEANCYATVDASLEHLKKRKNIDPNRIVVGGWSLGAAVAIDLAAREKTAGLISLSGFTSGVEMGRRLMPFLPVRLLLRHRFASVDKIGRVACPIFVGHGADDHIIPAEMADRLAAAARAPVTRRIIPGADHNDFFLVGGDDLLQALGRFLDSLPDGTP
jgi:hypothetical protein